MKTRSNKTLAKKGGKCGCSLSGGSYYKYNDLRNATPRDFLLSERDGAVGPLKGGRRRRRMSARRSVRRSVGGRRRTARRSARRSVGGRRRSLRRSVGGRRRSLRRSVGRRRRTLKRRQRGGFSPNTLLPQDIVNIGRSTAHDMGSFANAYRGIAASASPLPTQDQLNTSYDFTYKPVALSEIRADAEAQVSKL